MQQATLDNTHANTAKVKAETIKINADIDARIAEIRAEIRKMDAEAAKAQAEIGKVNADINARLVEMRKMDAEATIIHKRDVWYSLLIGSGATLAIGALIATLIKLFL